MRQESGIEATHHPDCFNGFYVSLRMSFREFVFPKKDAGQ